MTKEQIQEMMNNLINKFHIDHETNEELTYYYYENQITFNFNKKGILTNISVEWKRKM